MLSDVLPACPDVCSCTVYHFGSSTLNTLSYTLKGKLPNTISYTLKGKNSP